MKKVILVGTETGNSLDYATRLSEDFQRLNGEEVEIFLMDEFPLDGLLDEELEFLIYVCSTTGDGEEPGNMKKFMKFLLRADLPCDLFEGINFAVFGLGDSSYDKFNFVGKRLYRRMVQLGGTDFVGFRGEGDERHPLGIEFGWNTWWSAIRTKLPNNISKYKELDPLPPRCTFITKLSSTAQVIEMTLLTDFVKLKLLNCTRVTPEDHFQDTRLLQFKLSESVLIDFQPGDILNLKPSNDQKSVESLLSTLKWNGNVSIYGIEGKFSRNWTQYITPKEFPMSLKHFLTHYVDLSRIPSKSTIRSLACLCDLNAADYSAMHQEKLLELSRDEGEYLDYIWRPKRTIVEIIKDFQPTLKIEPNRILQIFNPIKPRQFSIANDPKKGNIELLIALVKEELPLGRGIREGLASKWIRDGRINYYLNSVTISHGSLNLRAFKSKIFLFAAGTGIAPLRAVIQKLHHSQNHEIFLYFGCRSLEKDYYFKDEWPKYKNLTVFAVGSRDCENGPRVYLDDIIKANPDPLLKVKDPNDITCIVAGHSRLNRLVQNTLIQIWKENGQNWIDLLKSTGQYQSETWS